VQGTIASTIESLIKYLNGFIAPQFGPSSWLAYSAATTMLSSGFKDAPVSRSLVFGIVAASLVVSITDSKYYFYIQVEPHLWRYHQLWRILIYQLCYTNSSEVLFAAMTLYNLRVIERLWGSRKFAASSPPFRVESSANFWMM
jgi:hypothetical protein